ncbi:MAG: iron-only hydrogenase system regulator [Kiritimatiellae bacterium]|nr:iron-only hydrogenase system regulator [Kiritimatiellia bacterium]
MERRTGFVGIILENRDCVDAVNHVLSGHAELILARVGLPRRDKGVSVITLVVEATTDELGELTGRLGTLPGVSVKSALSKQGKREREDG